MSGWGRQSFCCRGADILVEGDSQQTRGQLSKLEVLDSAKHSDKNQTGCWHKREQMARFGELLRIGYSGFPES